MQYAACLAAHVAAWETYLENVVKDFLTLVADPLDVRYSAVIDLLAPKIDSELKRFNTPKYGNARDLIYTSTGYDPINDWNWPSRGMGGPAVKNLVDEIVTVRHHFAHGAPMRAYSWNTNKTGQARLTDDCLNLVRGIFSHLAGVTDRNLSGHIKATYSIGKVWY
ncbi:HEPN domain-containing protein [Amycolatopsis sp. A133]|uniref:HEPN domain-containing protein n=1 Tax=Amycolatopsis sp. A133 TaxID=3064472 RepID=UPI0027E81483|nr:HEPN domain-containing protein [Amycolatopsis sp. A133]MDQ7809682.1 HEPN domain-containing protein [Amycolatopsis sp. A133]